MAWDFCLNVSRYQAGPVINQASLDTSEIITAISTFSESVSSSKTLVQPMIHLYSDSPIIEHADEVCIRGALGA